MDSNLTGEIQTKNTNWLTFLPWILSGVFFITTFVLSLVLILRDPKEKEKESKIEIDTSHFIPIEGSVFDDPNQGANANVGKYNILDTKYYSYVDVYNLKSSSTLTILENFKTYQQTSEFSCGCSCLLMSVYHKGERNLTEKTCVEISGSSMDYGASLSGLEKVLTQYGYEFESPKNFTEETDPLRSCEDFEDYVEQSLKAGDPVIILSADWSGHYLTIIGLDKQGNGTNNHVFLVADPYDTTDHIQDGYIAN